MIRIWPFAEAPSAFQTYPGMVEVLDRRRPVWLAHRAELHGGDADLVHDFSAYWGGRPGREVCTVAMGGAGILTVGVVTEGG